MTGRRVRLCAQGELGVGEVRAFDVDGRAICLARCASGLFALDDLCSHEDYPLSEGEVDPETCAIECWAHGSAFSLATGEPMNLPATKPVAAYPVELSGGDVFIVVDR